jgi:hypothetical protein
MGTWAHDAFGNDNAGDWAFGLEECSDLSLVESTLDKILNAENEYLEAPDAEEGLAAAEVIARLQGHWGERNPFTEPADTWVEKVKLKPSKALAQKAHRVIERILLEPSELLELWQESKDFEAWKNSVQNLKARIDI